MEKKVQMEYLKIEHFEILGLVTISSVSRLRVRHPLPVQNATNVMQQFNEYLKIANSKNYLERGLLSHQTLHNISSWLPQVGIETPAKVESPQLV